MTQQVGKSLALKDPFTTDHLNSASLTFFIVDLAVILEKIESDTNAGCGVETTTAGDLAEGGGVAVVLGFVVNDKVENALGDTDTLAIPEAMFVAHGRSIAQMFWYGKLGYIFL